MDALAEGFLQRVQMAVRGGSSVSKTAEWLVNNTKHPLDPTKPWSFHEHEYQIEILNDRTPEMYIRKSGQVGASEMSVRQTLAVAAIRQGIHVIYVLPTAKFASKFAKARFDPVIEASPTLNGMLSRDVDGADQKRLGNSFLYLSGTIGASSAISVPASALICDEIDFCDQVNLSVYNSRLGHLKEHEMFKRRFSTPTTSGRAVDKGFQDGRQSYYAVRHDTCGRVVVPDFFRDSVIPGYDGDNHELRRDDLSNNRIKFGEAWMKCPSCGGVITVGNLADPAKRMWVATFPDREIASYQVSPFDVAAINPVHRTWKTLSDYKLYSDWKNHRVGLPADDSENSILKELLEDDNASGNFSEFGLDPGDMPDDLETVEALTWGCYIGVDVGKTSNIVIGKRDPFDFANPGHRRKMRVLHVERIRQDGEDYLGRRLDFLMRRFGVARNVVDAAPDFTTSMGIVARFPGRAAACRYTGKVRRTEFGLVNAELDDLSGVVTAFRTGSLDEMVRQFNSGMVVLPRMSPDEQDLITKQLCAIKRVPRQTESQDEMDGWIWENTDSVSGDHYAHAINYMLIAESLDDMQLLAQESGIALAGKARPQSRSDLFARPAPTGWKRV